MFTSTNVKSGQTKVIVLYIITIIMALCSKVLWKVYLKVEIVSTVRHRININESFVARFCYMEHNNYGYAELILPRVYLFHDTNTTG